jgi:tetratricopeptide (TPR) repeat protein
MNSNLSIAVRLGLVASIAGLAASGVAAQISGECGNPFENAYGPFDYRTATQAQKHLVEIVGGHFTTAVETLQSGTTGPVGGEIDYTLRAFPNHPRALMAMIRLGQRDKTPKPRGTYYTVECYVERAVQFRPEDTSVRQVRGIYFSMQRKYGQAIDEFSLVIEQQPDNANAHYNLGLAYFETGDYDGARAEAKRALALGFPLQGLKDKLRAKRKWDE